MKKKTIAVIGSLDTKGEEFAFLKGEIEKRGCSAFVIDTGILGEPAFAPDINSGTVAAAAGAKREDLANRQDRGSAMDAMCRGISIIAHKLYKEGKFDAIISMGGGGGTAVGCAAMRALPIGVPKVMVSTVASSDVSPHVGASDIAMMPSVLDVAGLNFISRKIFSNAAAAICAMAAENDISSPAYMEKPRIAVSMFGNTTRAADNARKILEGGGYEVLSFSATGVGGKTMETLIGQGFFSGVLDITTTELADEICGGVHSAGPARLEAAGKAGAPQVVSPACMDMCNFFGSDTVPEKYKNRLFHHWNPNVTLMRTTPEENAILGGIFSEKLNAAKGPAAVYIPARGFSEVDAPGMPFWWPEADEAFVTALKRGLREDIPLIIMDCNVNDPEFSGAMAEALIVMLRKQGGG